jgi:hypothetical protein
MTPMSILPCTTFRDWLAILSLILFGCAGPAPSPEKPHQAEALAIVWAIYGSPLPPPAIDWQEGDELNCYPDETGQPWGWMSRNANSPREAECLAGLTWIDERVSQVARRPGALLSGTAIVHEPLHLALHDLTGDADAWHEGPAWGRYYNDGYRRGLDDDAQDAIEAAGL